MSVCQLVFEDDMLNSDKKTMRPYANGDHSDESEEDDSIIDYDGRRSSTLAQPPLIYKDDQHEGNLLSKLNTLRKEGILCDTVLAVGDQTVRGHRAVLACSSPRLMELFKEEIGPEQSPLEQHYKLPDHMDFDSLRLLIDYSYTCRLEVPGHMVSSVYRTAHKLKMERAAEICSNYLAEHVSLQNCLDVRAFANSSCDQSLTTRTDSFIQDHFSDLLEAEKLTHLPKFKFSLLGVSKEDLVQNAEQLLTDLVLQWLQSALVDNTFDSLTNESHVLYLTSDNTLKDAADESLDRSSDELKDSPIVQDYKKYCKSKKMSTTKGVSSNGRATLGNSPGNKKSQLSEKWVEKEWKIIATHVIKDRALLAIAMVADRLSLISLHTAPAQQLQVQADPLETSPISISATQSLDQLHQEDGGSRKSSNTSQSGSPMHSPKSVLSGVEKQLSLVPLAKMSTARCGLGTVVADDQLLAVGGYERGECLATAEAYDMTTNTWAPLTSMAKGRGRFDVTKCGRHIYCCGGSDGSEELKSVQYYDLDEKQWVKSVDMSTQRSSTGVLSLGNKIYVIGGWSGCNGINACEMLDLDTGVWSQIANMHERRSQVAVCRYDNKIIAVGGSNAWECLNSVEMYDPEKNEWTVLPSMTSHRRGASCAMFNGKMYVVGGSDGQYSLKTTEILDLETLTWAPGPSLNTPRANLCVSVYQGRLFSVGGFSGKKFLDNMEFLEVGSDEWSRFLPATAAGTNESSVANGDFDQISRKDKTQENLLKSSLNESAMTKEDERDRENNSLAYTNGYTLEGKATNGHMNYGRENIAPS